MTQHLDADGLYQESFCRNLGILSTADQETLRNSRIAVAGAGGVGGIYLATLARTGVGKFVIADPDTFEHSNLNRQYGATLDTIGHNKASVMQQMVLSINPSAEVRIFEDGLSVDNISEFLEGCDLVLDGLDAFNLLELLELHSQARNMGLFALKAVPMGFGATLMVFDPEGMSFAEYFKIEGLGPGNVLELLSDPKRIRTLYDNWIGGFSPSRLYEQYLGSEAYYPFDGEGRFVPRPLPSFCPSVHTCADLVSTEAVLLLCKKRPPVAVPKVWELDFYTHTFQITDTAR